MILPKPFESNTENPSDDTGNGRENSKAPSSEGSEDGEKGKKSDQTLKRKTMTSPSETT